MEYKNAFEMLRAYIDTDWDYDSPTIGKTDIKEILHVFYTVDKIKDYIRKHTITDYDEECGVTVSYNINAEEIIKILGGLDE
jgi:hypothetical protein